MATTSRNVEIKAKLVNVIEVIEKAKQLSSAEVVILNQKDTFYNSPKPNIRLKLREENGKGLLISYDRPNSQGPKLSKFKKCNVENYSEISEVLEDALGKKGVVKKQRFLFLVGQTRVHIDKVEDLGDFIELEVMLREDQSLEEGQLIAHQLMTQLGVSETQLLSGAYMDMLLPPSSSHSTRV